VLISRVKAVTVAPLFGLKNTSVARAAHRSRFD
jgi:hypothetical protein